MRARRAIALTLLAVVALPSAARANYAFQGVVSASGGWTNNASGAPVNSPTTPTDPDSFFIISPGVVFTSSLARAVQRLAYTFSALIYSHHPELSTLTNRLEWMAAITPTRQSELLLTAFGSQFQLNTLNTVSIDSPMPVQLTRAGTQTYWNAGTTESLIWAASTQWRLLQTGSFLALIPQGVGLSQSYTASGSIGAERLFRANAFAGILRLDYIYYQEQRGPVTNPDGTVNPDGVVLPTQQDVVNNLSGRWRRDVGNFWNLELSGGVFLLMRATDGGGRIWQPTAVAAVHYLHPKFQSDLMYTHGAFPNPLVEEVLVSDLVTLRATVPLSVKARVAFNAGGYYSHSREFDSVHGSLSGAIDLIGVDGGLTYSPVAGLALFGRYNFLYQAGGGTAAVPIPDLERHTVLFGLIGTYPTEAATVVPSRHALRVDGSDMTAIPDLHAQPQPAP